MAQVLNMGNKDAKLVSKRPELFRPWINPKDGKTYITVNKGHDKDGKPKVYHQPIQANGTLRRDEWKLLDEAVMGVKKDRLQGVQRLIDAGLTKNIQNAMGHTVYEWHQKQADANAQVAMSPRNTAENERPDYKTQYTPIPIILSGYEIDFREEALSQNMPRSISTDMAEEAARAVNEKLEDLTFTNESYSFGGGTLYSLVSTPYHAATGSLIGKWDDSSTSGSNIVSDVQNMVSDATAQKYYGPFELFIPSNYEDKLDEDYDVSGNSLLTIRERLNRISKINGITAVDRMPADTVLLVELNAETIRVLQGQGLTNIEWQAAGPFVTDYAVMTIQVPQVRWTYDGKTGIVKYTG